MTVANLDLVCVLIVNWNSANDTAELAREVRAEYGIAVTVVDNASSESCQEITNVPGVSLVRSAVNGGYGAGMNIGMAHASAHGYEWAWLLNPDCRPSRGALLAMLEHAESRAALGTLQLTSSDVSSAYLSAANLDGNKVRPFICRGCRVGVHDVDVLTGTGILLRVDVALAVGGFDESYFHYKEEFDLVARIAAVGGAAHVCGARLVHERGGSLSHDSPAAAYYHARNEVLYYRKRLTGVRLMLREMAWMLRVLIQTAAESCSRRNLRAVARARRRGLWDGARGRGGRYSS